MPRLKGGPSPAVSRICHHGVPRLRQNLIAYVQELSLHHPWSSLRRLSARSIEAGRNAARRHAGEECAAPRPEEHGHVGQTRGGLLPLRQRQLDEEQSHPARVFALEQF